MSNIFAYFKRFYYETYIEYSKGMCKFGYNKSNTHVAFEQLWKQEVSL